MVFIPYHRDLESYIQIEINIFSHIFSGIISQLILDNFHCQHLIVLFFRKTILEKT